MKKLLIVFVTTALLNLTACATPTTMSPQGSSAEIDKEARLQKEMALKRAAKEDLRVRNIAYPILKANAELCQDTAYTLGITAWNDYTVPKEYKDTANVLYGLGEVAQVQAVVKGTPAAKSGIKVGDKIISVNDQELPVGRNAITAFAQALDNDEPKIKLTLNRDGNESTATITRVKTCGYGVVYNPEDSSVNAYADGNNIIIPRGMIRFVDSDSELALVIAHELGHNAMGHMDKKKTNAMGAGLGGFALDILAAAAGVNTQGAFTDAAMKAGAGAYSVEFEQEADYVGMYFLERAGYKANNVANFWRRMASEMDDSNIKQQSTHPATAERFVAIEKTYDEIQGKKKKGAKLEPEIDVERQKKTNMKPREAGGFNQ